MADVNALQIIVNEVLQGLGEWLIAPMLVITAMGNEEFFVLMLPIIYWCFDQMIGLRVGIMLLASNMVNTFFKFLFRTPRPYWFSDSVKNYIHESSFGLPSGHAQTAASIWGWLAVEVEKRWFLILMLVLIFLIGVSRLILGVHFLGDVLVGWFLGALLVWAFSSWYKKVGSWLDGQTFEAKLGLVVVSTIILVLLIFGARWIAGSWVMDPEWARRAGDVNPYNLDGAFTLGGTWLGMLGGFVILMDTKGRFLAGEGGWRRLVRLVIGLLGIFILYFGIGLVFPRGAEVLRYLLRFIRFTLIGLWVSWLGPILFERINILRFAKQVDEDIKLAALERDENPV